MNDSLAKQFSEEIATHKGLLLKICRIYRGHPDDQHDLYQDIVLNAWRSYPRFEGKSKFSTWLYRVALNTSLHQNRKDKFFGKMTNLEAVENRASEESTDDQINILYRAIDQLDPIEKSLVILYLDELPYKEISEITGLTESNVGVRLNRIKIKMKNILSAYGIR